MIEATLPRATAGSRITDDLLHPLTHTSWRFYLLVVLLGSIVAAGAASFAWQVWYGLGEAGIRWPVYWGFYITNFVFWIGISHAGTLISAILRLVNAGWRRPVTRCAEVITAFALMIGAMFPIIHLGRPWLFFWLMPYPNQRLIWPNFRSPLVWDFFAISTYLTGSLLFLFLPMIPDFALVRDKSSGLRQKIYGLLALGWRGTTKQWHRLETGMSIMAIAIIPVAVSVHTIVSFDFSMAPVPGWHTTIFGPYFVAGAIFSGIAGLIIAMAALRRFLHLENYLHPLHFNNLGKLLLMMSLLWGYFVFAERLTTWYGNDTPEMHVFYVLQDGSYSPLYWTMVVCNFVVPVAILSIRRLRTITGCVIASFGVVVGMWLERFLIVVPTLGHKYLPYSWGTYRPQPVEIIIMTATFAAMTLLYVLFSKYVPIISIWELKAGQPHPAEAASPDGRAPVSGRRTPSVVHRASSNEPQPVYSLYSDGDAAQRAVNALRAAGVADADITVISAEPMEHYEFGELGKSSAMWTIASVGGLLGFLFATWLARFTAVAWPLNTGNMPIVAWWPNLIIMFELTMFGAIFSTVATVVITCGLLRRRPRLYDPAVSDGRILVGVEAPRDAAAVEKALALEGPPIRRS